MTDDTPEDVECVVCGETFGSAAALEQHLRDIGLVD